jgi:hypothetical protein
METPNMKESAPRELARPLLSPLLRGCYGLLDRRLRWRIGRLPGVASLYQRFLRPLMFPPPTQQDLVLIKFSGFVMYMDLSDLPGEMSLGTPYEPATTYVFGLV